MTSQPDPPTKNGGGFFTWLRGLGIARGQDRWLAGVASGLAARAGIDPLIVRGVFVVLAIVGGPAFLIYVAGWLLLPNAAGRIHVEDIVRGRADSGVITIAVIAAAVLILPVLFLGIGPSGIGLSMFFGFGAWDLWGALRLPEWLIATMAWLFWISVLAAGAFWLRHLLIKRGQQQQQQQQQQRERSASSSEPHEHPDETPLSDTGTTPSPSPSSSPNPSSGQQQNFSDHADRFGEKAQQFGEKAEQWGQETSQRVDAWSARLAADHENRKLGAGHVLITLALALLAAGFAAYAALQLGLEFAARDTAATPTAGTTVSSAAFTAPLIAAIIAALTVLALSLIVAGMRGRNTGVVGFLAFCGVVALLITAVLPWGTRFQPFGELQLNGHSVGAVSVAGNVDVDLRDLDLAPNQPADLVVWHGFGDLHINMPERAAVVVEVRMLAGQIFDAPESGSQNHVSGPFIGQTIAANLPPGAAASAMKTATSHVTVYMLAGKATVETPPSPKTQQSFTFEEVSR